MLNKRNNGDNMTLEDARRIYMETEKRILLEGYNFPNKPSSDGYYHLNVKDDTKKSGRRQLKAKTIDELKEKAYQYEKGINGNGRKTFSDVFKIVQEQRLKYVKDPEKLLSVKNSIRRNNEYYKRYFLDTDFEKKFIDEISKKDIENICYYNLQKYDLKNKAFLELRGIIKSVLSLAYEEYWIYDNPYDRIDFKKYKDMLVRVTPINQRVHSDDDVDRILDYLHGKQLVEPEYIPSYAFELQIVMGLRRGEVPPLMWSDIKDGYILISREQLSIKEKGRSEYFKIVNHTKTWKDRIFPITSDVQAVLEKIKRAHKVIGYDGDYLFPADTENGVINNNIIYKFYRRICDKLDIPISREYTKGTHSFRRNAITKTINSSGGNTMIASQLFGNTPKVAESNYYTGLDLNAAKNILEA